MHESESKTATLVMSKGMPMVRSAVVALLLLALYAIGDLLTRLLQRRPHS